MKSVLTKLDRQIVETLTRRVRVVTFEQISEHWFPECCTVRSVKHRLAQLVESRLVETYCINVHPMLEVNNPILCWQPGANEPTIERVHETVRSRWTCASNPKWVCVASPLAANLFGSNAWGLPAIEHRDHDLRLADIYLHYRQSFPRLARLWQGEHIRPKPGYREKHPDALLVTSSGKVIRAVESAGHYGLKQIEAFHAHCAEHDLPYELW